MKNQFTIGVALACLLPGVSNAQPARAAVEAAETFFSAQAAQAGTAAAFVANSAPNGLVVEQGKLLNAQELWAGRPAKSGQRLSWYPVLADVAQTGDLGYTTGPWTAFQNNRPQAAGEYVTVWRKQPDGKFRFVVYMGIERVGTAPAKATAVAAPRLLAAAATPSAAPTNILLDLDRKFAAAELLKPGATYQQYLSAEARLYRPDLSVMQGAAASANMKTLDGGYLFTATAGYLATSCDMGYVVGTLRRAASARHPEENGSYLRIWRREAVAGWRLVVEVFNLTPAPEVEVSAQNPKGTADQLPAAKRGQ